MYSDKPHCCYGANQLVEVICQLRFPEILTIAAEAPARFQDAIRTEYPQFHCRRELQPPKVVGNPGCFALENQPVNINYQFSTQDGVWRVNLTSKFISLACTDYTCWEDFAAHMDKPLYRPAYFQRVGLRYRNVISRQALGLEERPFSELIAPCYLGPLTEVDVNEATATRCTLDLEMAIRGGCRMQLHAGPAKVRSPEGMDKETKYIFDQDLYIAGNIPPHLSAAAMNTLHNQAWAIFRGAITDTLHNAMQPEKL